MRSFVNPQAPFCRAVSTTDRMFNPIEPQVHEPSGRTRRWPSLGRISSWLFTLGIPLVAVAAGIALFIASTQLDAAVRTYRNAPPCSRATTSTACYTTAPGTLVTYSISRGKSGDTTDMTLRFANGTRSTWAKTSWQQEDALHAGVPVQAKFYQGAITTVYVAGIGIQTKDNPIFKQSDLRTAAVLIPILGVIFGAVSFFSQRRLTRKFGWSGAIDRRLPIAEQEKLLRRALTQGPLPETSTSTAISQPAGAMLPFTLRPHPIPTGRPWWVGLIIVGLAVPLFLLRMRTPSSIAQLVLAATVAALLVAVVLHWLYRNRRMLVVDDFSVRRVNLFGFSRVVSRTDVARLECPIFSSYGMSASEPRLLLLDASGRCLLGLRRYYATDEEAAQLAAALRVPFDPKLATRLTSASQLRRTIPGAASWPEAHPYWISLLLLLPIFVAVCLFVWVLNGFQ
jgi:hypothetical protein